MTMALKTLISHHGLELLKRLIIQNISEIQKLEGYSVIALISFFPTTFNQLSIVWVFIQQPWTQRLSFPLAGKITSKTARANGI